jgi:translation elongation factor EF-G
VPLRPADRGAVHAALADLAEQDPLIDLRGDDVVSLYGEVQKEVVEATLAEQYGLAVTFRATTTRCIERLAGCGEADERNKVAPNPFLATVGLRVEPAPPGAGISFTLAVEPGAAEIPPDTGPAVLPVLAKLGGVPLATEPDRISGEIPAARVHDLVRALPALTRGEGVLESAFDHYERARTDANPLDRKEYLGRHTVNQTLTNGQSST